MRAWDRWRGRDDTDDPDAVPDPTPEKRFPWANTVPPQTSPPAAKVEALDADDAYLEQEYVDQVPAPVEDEPVEHIERTDEPAPPAIHLPLEDPAAMPEGYPVKGSITAGVYYTPDSPNYGDVVAEIWFADAEHAEANGFVRAY